MEKSLSPCKQTNAGEPEERCVSGPAELYPKHMTITNRKEKRDRATVLR